MRFLILPALLLACAAAFAQTVPDAPLPRGLEQAVGRAEGVTLPSFAEWQKQKQREFLAPKTPEGGSGPGRTLSFNRDANDASKRFMSTPRFTTEALDINLTRPTPRVTFGVGYANHDMIAQGRTLSHDAQKYGFVKLELGRTSETRKKLLWLPTATYTETEVSPRMRVSREEFNRGLKELKP